ncbi:MAG: transglutaminase-like domain-containing protein [Pseudomonadota bacterium]
MNTQSAPDFYVNHGEWSDPRALKWAFDDIEAKPAAIAATVQGLLLHDYFGSHLYADPPDEIDTASRSTLPIAERLPTLHDFGNTTLSDARSTKNRRVGTCRDFALLTCSIMRHHGIPSRVRCGFARYFHPPTFEDHWTCEYWDPRNRSWKMVDAQLDHAHVEHLSIAFDTSNVPKEEFLFPWEVWEAHRSQMERLVAFGHGDATGFWFVRVNLARDFLALNKVEASSWDTWRDQVDDDKLMNDSALAECDELARAAKYFDTSDQIDPTSYEELAQRIGKPHWQT